MEQTNELREKLTKIFSQRENWNKLIDVDEELYIYISSCNEIRRLVRQPSGNVAVLVACFCLGKLIWC